MKKEEIYVNLHGKTKEELTDLWEFLTSNGEIVSDTKEYFIETHLKYNNSFIALGSDNAWKWWGAYNKTEITIPQLKQIIKPMETFTPITMRCTQEQFEAIKPKLEGCLFWAIDDFNVYNYLINHVGGDKKVITNTDGYFLKTDHNRTVYEEWNEEIFLKACGIEVKSLEQQLQKAEAEVKRLQSLIEEENKIKIGDWALELHSNNIIKATENSSILYLNSKEYCKKITNTELIKLLEDEIK